MPAIRIANPNRHGVWLRDVYHQPRSIGPTFDREYNEITEIFREAVAAGMWPYWIGSEDDGREAEVLRALREGTLLPATSLHDTIGISNDMLDLLSAPVAPGTTEIGAMADPTRVLYYDSLPGSGVVAGDAAVDRANRRIIQRTEFGNNVAILANNIPLLSLHPNRCDIAASTRLVIVEGVGLFGRAVSGSTTWYRYTDSAGRLPLLTTIDPGQSTDNSYRWFIIRGILAYGDGAPTGPWTLRWCLHATATAIRFSGSLNASGVFARTGALSYRVDNNVRGVWTGSTWDLL